LIPYKHGIYIFAEQDDFYEGRFTATHGQPSARSFIKRFLSYIDIDGSAQRYHRRAMKYIKRATGGEKLRILDVGAGGGHSFLKSLGEVSSLDLSLGSLINALDVSDHCYQADCTNIPFEDRSFDLVFSSQLLGHIPLSQKQEAINEIFRVTKHGGYSVHNIECEADNVVFRLAKTYPELYQKYFKDMYGHYGIELPSACMARFRLAGFIPIVERSDYCYSIIRPVNSYMIWFGEREYYRKRMFFRVLKSISEILSFNILSRTVANIFIYPFAVLNTMLGKDGMDSIKVLYVKP
jgi:ubiquinone/menaquinone biosynthesis C-methylase UbiE